MLELQEILNESDLCFALSLTHTHTRTRTRTRTPHCHLLYINNLRFSKVKLLLAFFRETHIPQFTMFGMSILSESQRHRRSPPEIKGSGIAWSRFWALNGLYGAHKCKHWFYDMLSLLCYEHKSIFKIPSQPLSARHITQWCYCKQTTCWVGRPNI